MQTELGRKAREDILAVEGARLLAEECRRIAAELEDHAKTPEAERELQIGAYFGDAAHFTRLAHAIDLILA